MIRQPSVAGQFYSGSRRELTAEVSRYVTTESGKRFAKGIVSPHAGLIYSGHVAGAVYSGIEFPETFVLIGPNHTGMGMNVSIMSGGAWSIPTGELAIDSDLAEAIKKGSGLIREDHAAHRFEHSLEVQLPFIVHLNQDVRIVPILMMSDSLNVCREVGIAVAGAIEKSGRAVTIIASSDMSHYVDDRTARKRDRRAIDRILDLDPEGLYNTVMTEKITMCGVIPVTTMLYAALESGAQKAELVRYATSGEVSGDFDYVVGYAGIIIS
jgi:hypothetical protein